MRGKRVKQIRKIYLKMLKDNPHVVIKGKANSLFRVMKREWVLRNTQWSQQSLWQ